MRLPWRCAHTSSRPLAPLCSPWPQGPARIRALSSPGCRGVVCGSGGDGPGPALQPSELVLPFLPLLFLRVGKMPKGSSRRWQEPEQLLSGELHWRALDPTAGPAPHTVHRQGKAGLCPVAESACALGGTQSISFTCTPIP